MYIEVCKSKQRLTKNIVRQMFRGYICLCNPYVVLGFVVNIIPNELKTAIIMSGDEYYTLPMDYVLSSDITCVRKVNNKIIEFRLSALPDVGCRKKWWDAYTSMVTEASKTHIYLC